MPPPSPSPSPPAGSARYDYLRRRVVTLGILLILVFAASSFYDVWRSYRHSVEATDRELVNIATALAEQTALTWETVDLLLQDTARWYLNDGRKKAPELVNAALTDRKAGVRQVRELTIVDARGIQLHRSHGFIVPPLDVSDRSYFIAQRDGTAAGLFISEPFITRTEHRPAIELSQRLADDHGNFAGVVSASVDLQDLKQFYGAVNLGRGSAVQLLREDGTLLVRNPPAPNAVGRQFPQLLPASDSSVSRGVSPIDGQGDFIGFARVRDAPLVLTVTREEAVALRPWRDESIRVVLRTFGLALLGVLTIVALVRQLEQIEAGERALRESEERHAQSQKLEALGALAGGIAHDFNNILGAIMGYGELAQQHSPEGGALRRYLDNVMHAAERAKALVDRILGFSRSGLSERVPVNIQAVVEETLELLKASLPQQIRLEKHLEAGNAAVIGDATRLHQVTMNLCTNAVQAMERGGTLRIALECIELQEGRSLPRGSLSPGPYVRLTVSDTGGGIPPAVLDRIFDPFFTTKGVGEGTGLGLSLVHGIVNDLGGAIDVATRQTQGTTFTIWLPMAGQAARPAGESTQELLQGKGETVMIVDDERPLVALAEEMLAELGYDPVGFNSSGAALEAFRTAPQRFDVVLTDETMPELTGTDLARKLRQLRPNIPIVLMSGYGGAQLAERAGALGVGEVLRKPLQRRDLSEALARALRFA